MVGGARVRESGFLEVEIFFLLGFLMRFMDSVWVILKLFVKFCVDLSFE